MKQKLNVDVTYEGVTYNVTGDYYPADPGQVHGPAEMCYEGSDAYIDDMEIIVGEFDLVNALQPEYVVEIEGLAIAEHDSDDGGDYAYQQMKDDRLTGDA